MNGEQDNIKHQYQVRIVIGYDVSVDFAAGGYAGVVHLLPQLSQALCGVHSLRWRRLYKKYVKRGLLKRDSNCIMYVIYI